MQPEEFKPTIKPTKLPRITVDQDRAQHIFSSNQAAPTYSDAASAATSPGYKTPSVQAQQSTYASTSSSANQFDRKQKIASILTSATKSGTIQKKSAASTFVAVVCVILVISGNLFAAFFDASSDDSSSITDSSSYDTATDANYTAETVDTSCFTIEIPEGSLNEPYTEGSCKIFFDQGYSLTNTVFDLYGDGGLNRTSDDYIDLYGYTVIEERQINGVEVLVIEDSISVRSKKYAFWVLDLNIKDPDGNRLEAITFTMSELTPADTQINERILNSISFKSL